MRGVLVEICEMLFVVGDASLESSFGGIFKR